VRSIISHSSLQNYDVIAAPVADLNQLADVRQLVLHIGLISKFTGEDALAYDLIL
jgi:hypothetical protein